MPVNATSRKFFSDLVKGMDDFADNAATRYNYETVPVSAASATPVDNIGIPLLWNEAEASFRVLAAPANWAVTTAYSLGDIAKPSTRDGMEYVCTVAGTSGGSQPTFISTIGGETVDATVTWTARKAYAMNGASGTILKNKSRIAVSVGNLFGVGFNKKDTTLDVADVNMTVIYRGSASLISEGFIWGSVAAADQAEFLTALEDVNITTVTNADVVDPTFTS
jgi:hypothetical protein